MPQGGLGIAPGPALCPALRLSEAFEERGDGHDRRRVSYGTASIHYFPVAPSDNPAVSSGVGVAIAHRLDVERLEGTPERQVLPVHSSRGVKSSGAHRNPWHARACCM